MDPSYNSQLAAERVQSYIEMRNAQPPTNEPKQINEMKHDEHTLAAFQNPKAWRVVRNREDEDKEKAEAVFRIQGVLCGFDLPPVSDKRLMSHNGKKKPHQHMHLRQSVTVTGFSCPGFEDAVRKVFDTFHQVDKTFSTALIPWQLGMYEGHHTLTFNARYFTLRRAAPTEKGLGFGEGVDPEGVLKGLLSQDMIHTMDNKVLYCKRVEEEGEVRYETVGPKTFQAGDIVEVCFDFYCAPVRGGKVIFAPHLRSLTLLDDTLRTQAEEKARTSWTDLKPFTLKRMAWDMLSGEVEEVGQSFKRMVM